MQIYNLIDELLDKDLVKNTIENIGQTKGIDIGMLKSDEINRLITMSNSTDELLKNVEKSFGKDSNEYKAIKDITGAVKKEFDGITAVNQNLRKSKLKSLKQNITNLKDQINAPGITASSKEVLQERLLMVQRQYDIVDNASNLYQVTLRGGFGDVVNEQIKSAAKLADFSKIGKIKGLFSGFSAIIDEEAIKKELGFPFKGFIFSGLGKSSEGVYADPVSTSFLGELFTSDQDIENIKRFSGEIMQDFNDAISRNEIPSTIEDMLKAASLEDDLDYVPEYLTETRIRNKQFAKRIMELHQSGVSIRDSPQLMNMLAALHASEMYRVQVKNNVGTYLPMLPDVKRFAVSTEAAAKQAGTKTSPFSTASGMRETGGIKGIAGDLSKELLDFRVNNGSLLFGPGMTDRFFASLGGFDLDDKVLTKMMTYKDSGDVKRLLFGIYRQPSGPEESIYARANLDEGTLRSYFQNRRFEGLLNDYRVSAGPQSQAAIDDFYNVVWNKKNFTNNIDSEKAERLVIEIFDFAQSRGKAGLRELDGTLEGVSGAHNRRILRSIERQGASSLAQRSDSLANLAQNPLDKQYTRPGLFKLLVQEGGINQEEGTLVREELKKLLQNDEYKNVLETGLYNRLNEAVNDSRYGDIQRIFADNFNNPYLKGLKEQAVFDKMFNVVDKAETYQLGSYVNRSMLVGSRLNQTQDLIEEIAQSAFGASAEERVILEGRIKKILKYQVGLVAQDTAIDYSTSSSGVMPKLMNDIDNNKKLLTEAAEVYGYVTDESSALKTIERLMASGTLPAMGEDAVVASAKQMGSQYVQVMEMAKTFSPEKAQKFKDLYLPILDLQLLMGRSPDQDIARIIEGIRSGISEQATNKEDFKGILTELSDEKLNGKDARRNALTRIFGADAKHAYATLSKQHGVGTIIAANAETMINILMRRPTIDPSLASFEYTENAKKTSDYLLKKHSDQISRIANLTADASLLNDTDKFNLSMSKFFMADQVTAEIREAANLSGVSVQEMINTLKKRSYETNIRNMYDDLQYFPDGFDVQDGDPVENFRKLMNAADVNRRKKYLNKFYGGNMEYGQDASGALKMLKGRRASKIPRDQGAFKEGIG